MAVESRRLAPTNRADKRTVRIINSSMIFGTPTNHV
jgi:hypothetical protein